MKPLKGKIQVGGYLASVELATERIIIDVPFASVRALQHMIQMQPTIVFDGWEKNK